MPREKELYRDNLQMLRERFPGKETISIQEASKIVGVSRQSLVANKDFPKIDIGNGSKNCHWRVPIIKLASYLS